MPPPGARPLRVLFLCSHNRRRSATAERIFCKDPELEVRSAGTSEEALVRVNERMLDWAEVVFVMDPHQVSALNHRFPAHPTLAKIVSLEIDDVYPFMDERLVALLRERSAPHLERLRNT